MKTPKLVVTVNARFDWMEPPSSPEIEAMRAQANVLAGAAAHQLNQAVQLIILELLNS